MRCMPAQYCHLQLVLLSCHRYEDGGDGLHLPTAVAHTGGRVSDSFDQRVLTTYLAEYFGDFLFDTYQPFHFYCSRDGTTIDVPPTGPRDVYIKAVDSLPLVQSPEVN